MTLIVSLVAALSLSLLGSLLNDAAAAVKANEKLAALIKAAQTEGMLNLVWGENTFRGLHGVRQLLSCRHRQAERARRGTAGALLPDQPAEVPGRVLHGE